MNKNWTVLFIIIVVCLLCKSCISFKKELVQKGNINEAIHNAILDFSKTSKLYKRGEVFSVRMVKMDEGIMTIRIGINNMNLLLTDKEKIGSVGMLPTQCLEKESKLFFWKDNNFPLTKESLELYRKYNVLQDDEDGTIVFPDFIIDDSQKAVHYYFCKDNLLNYKKVTTNQGIGFYKPKLPECFPMSEEYSNKLKYHLLKVGGLNLLATKSRHLC